MEYRDTAAPLRKSARIFCILTIILLAGSLLSQAQVFTHDSGPLNEPDSWTDAPQNFTDDGQTFIIEAEAATDGDWSLSGDNSRLIISTPEEITFPAGSTVTFDGITIEFGDQAGGNLIADSDIVLQNGIEWEYDQPEDVWTLILGQNGSPSLASGENSEFLAFDVISNASSGTIDLLAHDTPVTVLQALNNLSMDFVDDALFRDNGNTISIGRDITLDGAASSYQLTGTLEHRVFGGTAGYKIIIPELNHVHIIAQDDGNPRFRNEQSDTREITINGDFTVDMDGSSDLEYNDVELIIGGNFILDHHRPEHSPDQGAADFNDAIISVGNDMILNISSHTDDDKANIFAGNGVFSIEGNVLLNAGEYGAAHFGASLFNIQGDAEINLSDAGSINMDDTEVYIDRNLTFDLDSRGDFRFGTSYVFVMQDIDLTHHRPESTAGTGMVSGEQAVIDVVGNFNVSLSGDEPDDRPNLDLGRAEIVVESDMNLIAMNNGIMALNEAIIDLPNGSLFLEAYHQSSLNLDNGAIISAKNVDFLLDETSGTDFADAYLNAGGNVTIDAADHATLNSAEFGLILSGSSDQTVAGLHSVAAHTFDIVKDGGFVHLQNDLTATSLVTIDLKNDASFSDGGHTLETGEALFRGSGNAFDLSGELVLTEAPLTKSPALKALQSGGSDSADPAADNGSGYISFTYKQIADREVHFDLFIQDELPGEPDEPFESFTLSGEHETESTGTLPFANDLPYIIFIQDHQARGGSVAITDLEWMLPGEDAAGPVARTRLIHNAADPAIDALDIYVNDQLFAEEVGFRQTSPLVTLPADSSLQFKVFGHGDGPDEHDALFSMDDAVFSEGGSYSIIASGVTGDGFAANPEGIETDFNLHILESTPASEESDLMNLNLWHGVTDAPAVDIWIQDGPALMDDASYTDHSEMFTAMATDYQFNVGHGGSSGTGDPLFEITGDLSAAAGSGAMILASGFLEPKNNEDGPGFGLLVVLSDGSTFILDATETRSGQIADRPDSYRLDQNFPNPFNPVTTITFSMPESSHVTLEIFDLQGRRVATLVDGQRSAGDHTVTFDAAQLSSGAYLYRLHAGEYVRSRQMMLVK